MAGAMMGMQGGTAISGDIVGGIGSLIAGENYKRPRLPPATGPELRLRQLAQSQLLGGGQQLLGATALYNQLAPILMSQLPGMHYVPGGGGGGATGTGSQATQTGQPGGATTSPMASYQQALQNYQNQQALAQQRTSMRAQLKGMTAGPARHALRQQLQGVKRAIKSMPDAAALERQQYLAGAQPGYYDVRMGGPDTSGAGTPGGLPTSDTASLGSINDLLSQLGSGAPNYLSQYQQALGNTSGNY
jgi:hypothetical protein